MGSWSSWALFVIVWQGVEVHIEVEDLVAWLMGI